VELPRDYTLKSHWPDCSGMVAGIESEWWPESNRNGGRNRIGMVAGFVSERWTLSRRNRGRIRPEYASHRLINKSPTSHPGSQTVYSIILVIQ